ncbi:hypothetical protein [Dictyobacter kobayashii]|uniref:hypothetical protein n=1 Tax=Dictyobacter kobayashii TaxID=2014872 RepID=UPI0010A94FA8|nr:hypothetical protein [Dictyobacter kobayashii]
MSPANPPAMPPVPWSPYSGSGIQQQFSPARPVNNPTWIPGKVDILSSTDLSRLPRPHFQVYANVDGKRSVAEIAYLLRTTPDRIENILRDLVSWGLVRPV